MPSTNPLQRQDSFAAEIEDEERAAANQAETARRPLDARARLRALAERPSPVGDIARRMRPFLPPAMRIDPSRYDHLGTASPLAIRLAAAVTASEDRDCEDETFGDLELLEEGETEAAVNALISRSEPDIALPIAASGYISPFASAISDTMAPNEVFRFKRLAANDVAMDDFLRGIAAQATTADLLLVSPNERP